MRMNAMIMAAGKGTRLKPWTDRHPKALVPVGGEPMLQRVMEKIRDEGFTKVVVNVHHFADQIKDFINEYKSIYVPEVIVSDESELLLDTGGALCAVADILENDEAPLLVHNVDILSDASLATLVDEHLKSGNDITLLTSDRFSTRRLAFDDNGILKGWHNIATDEYRPVTFKGGEEFSEEAFSGIYVISHKALQELKVYKKTMRKEVFPIMDFLLSAPHNIRIGRHFRPALQLIDIGKPDTLAKAQKLFDK